MHMHTAKYTRCYIVLMAIWLCACAQVGTITGGDKDVTPPKILQQQPENNTTGFHGDEIRLTFDEFVELVNPDANFMISPPTQENPQYSIKGKSLIIDLKECHPDSNTTYIITCNQGIKDYTEGNMLPEQRIVFSTGNHIDSLCICGTIHDAFTHEPVKDIYVLLHTSNADSALCMSKPQYVSKTNKQGQYLFTNLPMQTYYISALDDKNQNMLYDQADERIAFNAAGITPYQMPVLPATDTTTADSSMVSNNTSIQDSTRADSIPCIVLDSCHMLLFTQTDTTVKYMKKELLSLYHYQLIFRNKVQSLQLQQISSTDTLIGIQQEICPSQDTVHLFFTDTINYDIDYLLVINGIPSDTITLNAGQKPRMIRRSSKTEEETKVYVKTGTFQEGSLLQHHILTFAYPITNWDAAAIQLVVPHDTIKDTLCPPCHFTDSLQRYLEIDYDFTQEKASYTLLCPDSVFYTAYGWCNDSLNITINTASLKDLGSLTLNYNFYAQKNYIAELLNEKKEVVQQDFITYNQKITYPHLAPGKYSARIIIDDNHNGKWDCGNYVQRLQPETVIYMPKMVEVRANWTIEETFDVITADKQ